MKKKFQLLVIDPPYSFSDKLSMSKTPRGASANYDVMSIADIKNLPIKNLIHPDGSILALWVPSCLLQDGLDIMKNWGFTYKQTYIWVKTKKKPIYQSLKPIYDFFNKSGDWNQTIDGSLIKKCFDKITLNGLLSFGLGRLFRQSHEICLIGTSDNKIYKQLQNRSQRSVGFAENLKHSAKPENLQDSLEIMFPNATDKIEIFARRLRSGWICLGNSVCNGEDIRVSLSKL